METMERDAEYIASQCKYIRKMFSLTQENLADASGLTVRTIQKVESGRHVPEVQGERVCLQERVLQVSNAQAACDLHARGIRRGRYRRGTGGRGRGR